MPKYNEYSDAGPLLNTDLLTISRSPFTADTFFSTTPLSIASFVTDGLNIGNAHIFQSGVNFAPTNPLGNINVLITFKATMSGINFTLPSMSVNDANSSDIGTLFYILATPDSDNFNLLNPDGSTLVSNVEANQLIIIGVMSKNTSVNGTLQIFYNSNVSNNLPVNVTTSTQQMTVNTVYIANNSTLVTFTLPTTAKIGDVIKIKGYGAATGGWIVTQHAGQTIHMGTQNTTTGTGGSIASQFNDDCIELTCVVTNTDFIVSQSMNNLTIV